MGIAISWVLPIKGETLLVWKENCYEETATDISAAKQLDTKFPPSCHWRYQYLQNPHSATTCHGVTDLLSVRSLRDLKVFFQAFLHLNLAVWCGEELGSCIKPPEDPWRMYFNALGYPSQIIRGYQLFMWHITGERTVIIFFHWRALAQVTWSRDVGSIPIFV